MQSFWAHSTVSDIRSASSHPPTAIQKDALIGMLHVLIRNIDILRILSVFDLLYTLPMLRANKDQCYTLQVKRFLRVQLGGSRIAIFQYPQTCSTLEPRDLLEHMRVSHYRGVIPVGGWPFCYNKDGTHREISARFAACEVTSQKPWQMNAPRISTNMLGSCPSPTTSQHPPPTHLCDCPTCTARTSRGLGYKPARRKKRNSSG